MTTIAPDDAVARLRAWVAGRPEPRWRTRGVHVASDPFVVALVRMGGEGRPWAIASGHASGRPSLRSVADPRDQASVARMAEAFGDDLLGVFPTAPRTEGTSAPQLWLPDPSHLDLLHQMAFAYGDARWPLPDMRGLNRTSRLLNALFLQWQHPSQQTVAIATDVLRALYTFPATPARQGHLGFLLEWLNDHGDRTARLAAATVAEERSVSTTVDGAFERRVLAPLLERYVSSGRADQATAGQLRSLVEEEVAERWDIAVGALRAVRGDPRPENPGLATIRVASEQSWNRLWVEPGARAALGQPVRWRERETDRDAVQAATEMYRHELADQQRREALAHGDEEIAVDLARRGKGMVCRVTAIDRSEGTMKVRYSVPDALDVRAGTTYQPMGQTKVELKAVDSDPANREVTFSIRDTTQGGSTITPRTTLTLVEHAPPFLTTKKIDHMGKDETQLDALIRGARDVSDERPGPDGDDE